MDAGMNDDGRALLFSDSLVSQPTSAGPGPYFRLEAVAAGGEGKGVWLRFSVCVVSPWVRGEPCSLS